MTGNRGLLDLAPIREAVIAEIEAMVEEGGGQRGGQTVAAGKIGVSPQAVSQAVRLGIFGASVVEGVLKARKIDLWDLVRRHRGGAAVEVEEDASFPDRARAIAAAKLLGVSPAAIEKVRSFPGWKDGRPTTERTWFNRILLEEQDIKADDPDAGRTRRAGDVEDPTAYPVPPAGRKPEPMTPRPRGKPRR
jgi:hypothetical protein